MPKEFVVSVWHATMLTCHSFGDAPPHMWLVWLLNRVWHLNCYRYTVCFVFEINLWCPHLTGDTRCYFYLRQKATRTNLEERQPHGSHHPTHTHLRYANEKERWVETHLSANYTPSPTPIPTPSEIFNPWKTGYFVQKAGFWLATAVANHYTTRWVRRPAICTATQS